MSKYRDISHFRILDWDFIKEDSRHFLHNICWYPSRFIPIIPAHLIQALSNPDEIVLDPFCGAGTTIIEAMKLGRNAIGVELNPVGEFLTLTKAKILSGKRLQQRKMVELQNYLKSLLTYGKGDLFPINRTSRTSDLKESVPNYQENSDWYHPDTLIMLCDIYHYIEDNLTGVTKDISRIIFMSILTSSTGYERDKNYAYFADNVKPKSKKVFKNAYKLFHFKLNRFIDEISSGFPPSKQSFVIYQNDARNINKLFFNKVDLIVTSPPYLAVTDYTTAFRLVYLWYDFLFLSSKNDLQTLKNREIGARWKRKHREKLNTYLTEMHFVLHELSKCLKNEKYLCLVLGESKNYGEVINNNITTFLTKNLPFELIDVFKRNISKKFFLHPNGAGVHTEEIMIFRKGA